MIITLIKTANLEAYSGSGSEANASDIFIMVNEYK